MVSNVMFLQPEEQEEQVSHGPCDPGCPATGTGGDIHHRSDS